MNEKENEKVTRRKFLEDSSRKAIGGTAAAFLGLSMIEPKTVHAEHCWFSCAGECVGCTGGCGTSCSFDCSGGCTYGCTGTCEGCTGSCSSESAGPLQRIATEVDCGTPVEERTSSTRNVTV